MIGYKVVRIAEISGEKQLVNCYLHHPKPQQYIPGVPTKRKPHWGPLVVFNSPWRAERFCLRNSWDSSLQIWRCEYTPTESKTWEVWFLDDEGERAWLWEFLPHGTALADSITLIEEV